MRKLKKPKHISEMLNARQEEAIRQAQAGSYAMIANCWIECVKAENKALESIELGVPEWGRKTAEHYCNLRQYLEGFIIDPHIVKMLRDVYLGD